MSILNPAQPTLAAALWPAEQRAANRALRFALLAVLGVVFIALCSQAQVPFYPVPMTGQTFAVLTVGMIYGWRLSAATLLLYMAAGAVGIPVFAHWSHGPGVIAGATGGYIIGFVLAALLLGFFAERGWSRNVLLGVIGMMLANILIYIPGVPWLAVWYGGPGAQYIPEGSSSWGAAFSTGLTPFLLGDLLKLLLATCLVRAGWSVRAALLAKRRG
jgi:biotin transport system substrate-specific component